ncbi:MAG TPA: sarcosine oxidase subunit alpha family protein [Steroidobacteraceae bacterium]|nr:sarcosine oxidase subunit alpha family protein [Steroidobacteraceae bacterium]
MSAWRSARGGRVDRGHALRFRFDGRAYQGLAGDTLASALLANGVHLVARSFKYHRPRGIVTAGAEEPNALVTVRRDAARETPNLRATQVELYEGLVAESQNRWPSLEFDVGRASDFLSPFFPAGFYYKTFMWPRPAWSGLYEPLIRRAAGLGRAPMQPDPDRYVQRHAHCDVLVVGAGPAGLAAALAAAAGGARVIVCDEQPEPGGSLLDGCAASIDGEMADAWLAWSLAELAGNPRVRVLPRTMAFGYFPHNNLGLVERLTDHLADPAPGRARERLWQVRAREVVLATGAIEQPLVFPGNDRPGVMLAGAARSYLGRYGVRAGKRTVVVTATDGAYRAALQLAQDGVEIAAIADLRAAAPQAAADAARDAGMDVYEGASVRGTRGGRRVSGIDVDGRRIACDLVLMSGGWAPSVHLFSQSRGRLTWSDAARGFVPSQPAERTHCAGACRGAFGLAAALADGAAAGIAAARASGHPAPALRFEVSGGERGPDAAGIAARPSYARGPKAFVDFQNDVTARDLALATQEGFLSIEHVKRYTTAGMATDQGKTSSLNTLGIVASRLGKTVPEVGHTTFRMPYTPVSFGSLAGLARGDLFDPVRTTPMHECAVRRGAVFEDVGQWKRARYFPRAGEDMHAAVARECRAVRSAAGVFDASTLGKIAVVGPGAAEFLNRLYVNDIASLAPGRCRYGILLRDDGFVYDDGVIARLAPDHFHVTTTTGGAARVLAMMEDYRQTEWTDLEVWLTSVTEQWAVIALQGPLARQVLTPLVQGIDLLPSALPHMAVAEGRVAGAPAKLFRVSFTGELGYEINVPADHGRSVWEAVCEAGAAAGIAPYGTETTHVLRAEKGYIIVGQDTDGTATLLDAGLGWAVGRKKPDFVGKRSLERASMQSPARKQLVGLRTKDPSVVLEEGAQIVETAGQRAPMKVIGHVTSAYASAALGHSIALAMVSGGRAREGAALYVPVAGGEIAVTVTKPVFYDPEGARLHA